MERTLIIVKPDGVQRGLVGAILARFEQRGLKIAALKFVQVSRDLAEQHYAEHAGKGFYEGLLRFITSSPVAVMVFEGPNAIEAARATIGGPAISAEVKSQTNPLKAAPGTIRGDLGLMVGPNLVHGSANADDAAREIALWFASGDLVDYRRGIDDWILE